MPGEFVSSSVFNEEEIIQNNGKLIKTVAAVSRIYIRKLLSMGQ
jgi:hypothetical protein